MAIENADDLRLIVELLQIKSEISEKNSLRDQILKEGVEKRLKEKLGIQTTLIGRIEPSEDFEFLFLKDINNKFPELPVDEKKQFKKVPIKLFLEKLKEAFKLDLDEKIKQLNVRKNELDKII